MTGEARSGPVLPKVVKLQMASATRLYAPVENVVFDAATGAVVWQAPSGIPPRRPSDVGTLAGPCVVFTTGTLVLAACPGG